MHRRVLIAGVSTRALAESAARAGFDVTALDAYGDLDQHPSVRALSLVRDLGVRPTPHAAARCAARFGCDAVVYVSSFDNHPRAVTALASGRALWGNPPEILRRVRNPLLLARALQARGYPTPALHVPPSLPEPHVPEPYTLNPYVPDPHVMSGFSRAVESHGRPHHEWLVKPLASGGGHAIRHWRPLEDVHRPPGGVPRIPRGRYLQEHIEGTPGSVVFVAARGAVVPLGLSRQLVGERAFGATGFRYCGSILAPAGDPQFARDAALMDGACAVARSVVEEFGLVGLSGIDFVARDGVPYPIEVNPRWCASMELVERAYGVSIFGAHAAACAAGELPVFDVAEARRTAEAVGKAVVFATREIVTGDTRRWLDDPGVRDVPQPGERIGKGRPICTVLAAARDAAACHAALVRRAEAVAASW